MKIKSEVKIGLIAIVVVAGFLWGVNFLKGKNLFVSSNRYSAIYQNVGGLEVSSPVLVNGYKVGLVSDIRFIDGKLDKIKVELLIKSHFKFPVDSRAEIISADFLGSMAVNLVVGSQTTYLKNGDTLTAVYDGSLGDQLSSTIAPIKDKAVQLIETADSALYAIQALLNEDARKNLQMTISHIEQTTGALRNVIVGEQTQMRQIFKNLESISSTLEKNNEVLTRVIGNFSAISDSIAASELKSVVDNLAGSLEQTNEILAKINQGQGTAGRLVHDDSLYVYLTNVSSSLDHLLIDMRENPKRYVHFSLFGKGNKK